MSRGSWPTALREALSSVPCSGESPRVAVVGIGHELRGDDAAGLWLARALQRRTAGNQRLLVIEAGPAPENFCGLLRRFRPDLVLLVDAAQLQAKPGTVRWLSWQDATGITASTHTLPVHILATYLAGEFGCAVALLGIQPADTCIGAALTMSVREAAETAARILAQSLLAGQNVRLV